MFLTVLETFFSDSLKNWKFIWNVYILKGSVYRQILCTSILMHKLLFIQCEKHALIILTKILLYFTCSLNTSNLLGYSGTLVEMLIPLVETNCLFQRKNVTWISTVGWWILRERNCVPDCWPVMWAYIQYIEKKHINIHVWVLLL